MALRCGFGFALGATILVLLFISGTSFPFTAYPPKSYPPFRGFPPKSYPPFTGLPPKSYPPFRGFPPRSYPPFTGLPPKSYPPFTAFPPKSYPPKPAVGSSNITVGGSDHWRFGFNYSDWAFKNAPFYLGDSLVFQYDPPINGSSQHSVYLLRNYRSFQACDFRGAKLVANVSQGGGQGFKFVLQKSRPYYFACGEHDGIHCKLGLMKFPVFTFPFKRFHG